MTGTQTLDVAALERVLEGQIVGPAHDTYDELRAGFNGMIDKRPAAMVLVASEADVAAAIAFAREHALPLAIRGGGHSAPGFGCCDDGIVVDVRELKHTHVDPGARTIRCGAGLTWKEFDAATQAHGLAVTGGRVSSTGVAGLTIGSGSGWLERAMGLTSDSLVAARVVTADGEPIEAGPEDPELLWALRGGGGNFGVITEFTFALRPLGPVILGGVRMFPFEDAPQAMRRYREIMVDAPLELCGGLAFLHAPPAPFVPPELRGRPVLYPNFLAADEPAGVTDAYSPATLNRLRAVKDRLDPGNVFRINHNIAPTALAG